MSNQWPAYHERTKDREPSPVLAKALEYVGKKDAALDLGAGALVESKFLLAQGFKKVVALDKTPFEPIDDPKFEFVEMAFEDYVFPENTFDLINAQLALPFTKPESFDGVWAGMKNSLIPGGVFSGQLFGINDAWSKDPKMTFHSKEDIEKLLEGMETIELLETEKDGTISTGEPKHWHLFRIIAKKS